MRRKKLRHCTMYHSMPMHTPLGELYWESYLAGRIVPEECKVKPGRVRMELKLRKAGLETWTDYEVLVCIHSSGVNNNVNSDGATHTCSRLLQLARTHQLLIILYGRTIAMARRAAGLFAVFLATFL